MKKEFIYWFSSIITTIFLIDALLYQGHQNALALIVVIYALSIKLNQVGIKVPMFASLLCGCAAMSFFFILLLSLPLYGYSEGKISEDLFNIVGSTSAICILVSTFLGLGFEGNLRDQKFSKNVIGSSLSGYTEGDYRFPTDEELEALRENWNI